MWEDELLRELEYQRLRSDGVIGDLPSRCRIYSDAETPVPVGEGVPSSEANQGTGVK